MDDCIKPPIPPGYRQLEHGEIKEEGDKYWYGGWERVTRTIGHPAALSERIIRPQTVTHEEATESLPHSGYGQW